MGALVGRHPWSHAPGRDPRHPVADLVRWPPLAGVPPDARGVGVPGTRRSHPGSDRAGFPRGDRDPGRQSLDGRRGRRERLGLFPVGGRAAGPPCGAVQHPAPPHRLRTDARRPRPVGGHRPGRLSGGAARPRDDHRESRHPAGNRPGVAQGHDHRHRIVLQAVRLPERRRRRLPRRFPSGGGPRRHRGRHQPDRQPRLRATARGGQLDHDHQHGQLGPDDRLRPVRHRVVPPRAGRRRQHRHRRPRADHPDGAQCQRHLHPEFLVPGPTVATAAHRAPERQRHLAHRAAPGGCRVAGPLLREAAGRHGEHRRPSGLARAACGAVQAPAGPGVPAVPREPLRHRVLQEPGLLRRAGRTSQRLVRSGGDPAGVQGEPPLAAGVPEPTVHLPRPAQDQRREPGDDHLPRHGALTGRREHHHQDQPDRQRELRAGAVRAVRLRRGQRLRPDRHRADLAGLDRMDRGAAGHQPGRQPVRTADHRAHQPGADQRDRAQQRHQPRGPVVLPLPHGPARRPGEVDLPRTRCPGSHPHQLPEDGARAIRASLGRPALWAETGQRVDHQRHPGWLPDPPPHGRPTLHPGVPFGEALPTARA